MLSGSVCHLLQLCQCVAQGDFGGIDRILYLGRCWARCFCHASVFKSYSESLNQLEQAQIGDRAVPQLGDCRTMAFCQSGCGRCAQQQFLIVETMR